MEILRALGWVLAIALVMALWVIPDPIGKIIELWHFFRGDRLDEE